MNYVPHRETRYRQKWIARVKERDPLEVADESLFIPRIEELFKELSLKYGVSLWSAIVESSTTEDLRRMADLVREGVSKRVPLLSIYKKIGELEGLNTASEDGRSDDRGVVTGPGAGAPSVSPDLFSRTG